MSTAKRFQLPDLSNPIVTKSVAATYSFKFNWGWAIFTVNDQTGEFSIQSDWGNYSYRWNINHLGEPNLTTFLAHMTEGSYVADKLHYGRPQDREEFDEDATKRGLKLRVGEFYGETRIDLEQAKELLDIITDLDWYNTDSFLNTFDNNYDELKILTIEPYEWIRHRYTCSYTILVEALLPFFFKYLHTLLESK